MSFFDGLAGGIAQGVFGLLGQSRQQSFQKKMSNTQYQRAMADMRKAGLNPILAYKQGGAGNLPGASAGSIGNIGLDAVRAQHSARQQKKIDVEEKALEAQAGNLAVQAGLGHAQTTRVLEETERVKHEAEIAKLNINSAKAQAAIANQIEEYANSELGAALIKLGAGGQDLNKLLSAFSGLMPTGTYRIGGGR